jgi:hypothetical protein
MPVAGVCSVYCCGGGVVLVPGLGFVVLVPGVVVVEVPGVVVVAPGVEVVEPFVGDVL